MFKRSSRYLDVELKKKEQVGKDQEKVQSEKDSQSKNQGGKKTTQQSGTYTMKTPRKPNEQLFSQHAATQPPQPNQKHANTHKAPTAHKYLKHQDTKQKEPPQKHRPGTISNTKLLAGLNRLHTAATPPSASAVVHNI